MKLTSDEDTYRTWAHYAGALLKMNLLWPFVNDATSKVEGQEDDWEQKDAHAWQILLAKVDPVRRSSMIQQESAAQAWKMLERKHLEYNKASISRLQSKLLNVAREKDMKVERKVSTLMFLNSEIALVDKNLALNKEWLTTILLDSMPPKYDLAVTTFRTRKVEEEDILIQAMLFLRDREESFAYFARQRALAKREKKSSPR